MPEKNEQEKLNGFLESLGADDREWFEERIAIIQFSQGKDVQMTEIEAARLAFRSFNNWKKSQMKGKRHENHRHQRFC